MACADHARWIRRSAPLIQTSTKLTRDGCQELGSRMAQYGPKRQAIKSGVPVKRPCPCTSQTQQHVYVWGPHNW